MNSPASREASKKDAGEYAEDTDEGVRQPEKPRRNLINVALYRNPNPEGKRSHGRPPPSCEKPDHETTKKQGGDDHSPNSGPGPALLPCLACY